MFDIKAALNGTLRRMHYVQRYSSVPVINPENVAEHSWQITMLSFLIGENLRKERGYHVDIEFLVVKALVHDVSECLSGDIIRSFKHSSEEMSKACARADALNMQRLADEVGGAAGHSMLLRWASSKDASLEGKIVKLADMLCVVSYCVSEHRLGNSQVDFILKAVWDDHLSEYQEGGVLTPYVRQVFPDGNWNDPYKNGAQA